MSEWSWRRGESPRRGVEQYEITRGGTHVGTLQMHGTISQPSLVLGGLCDLLAGPAATKPETPLGQPAADDVGRRLSDRQRGKIHVSMAELGYRDRPARLAAIGKVVGRTVDSTNDLTPAEASLVIDRADAALRKRHRDGAA